MPISRDEFEKGRTQETVKARIEKILDGGQGYTSSEMMDIIFPPIKVDTWWKGFLIAFANTSTIKQALDELTQEGKVETREIDTTFGKQTYYAKKKHGEPAWILG